MKSEPRTPYVALARKYRPQTFADLVGQPHVTATLTRALESQRIAQAYLFAGQRGVGKTSAARILAKCLNCDKGPTAKPCQTCASCAQITQGSSLDVIEIDGASNRGIDEIRSLRETVPFAPTTGQFRVYIIDEVHMLTAEAFNALLKTLEEPPAHVKFIFATTAPNKIPATILSRCQRFDFRRVEASSIVGALSRIAEAEKIEASEPALYAIARAADGSLRDAEVMLEQAASFVRGTLEEQDVTALLGAVESEALARWAQAILERKAPEALSLLTAQLEQGRDPLQLLTGLLRYLRNLLIVASAGAGTRGDSTVAQLVDEPPERLVRLREQAGGVSPQELLVFLQLLTGAYELVRRSPMAQLVLELAVIKLATREEWQSLSEISRRLEALAGRSRGRLGRLLDGDILDTDRTAGELAQDALDQAAVVGQAQHFLMQGHVQDADRQYGAFERDRPGMGQIRGQRHLLRADPLKEGRPDLQDRLRRRGCRGLLSGGYRRLGPGGGRHRTDRRRLRDPSVGGRRR